MASRPSEPYARTLSVLWWALFLVSAPFGSLTFILPIYGKKLGASAMQIGAFVSALSIVPVIARPFLGLALDRWGRRPFLLLGLGAYAAAMVVFCQADSVRLLTLARFVQGIGQAFLWLTAITMVADLAAAGGRGRSFGLIEEATSRGALVGTSAGLSAFFSLLAGGTPMNRVWFWLFLSYTVPALLALAIGWRSIGETRPGPVSQPVQARPHSRQLWALMAIVFITGAASAMVWPLLMVFLQDTLHAGLSTLSLAYLPAALITSFLPSRLGRITDRTGRKPSMIAGLLVGAAASALIPHLRSVGLLAILWTIESVSYAAATPAERAFVADIAGEDVRGGSYGLYTFAFFLGTTLGPLAGGWLYDHVSHSAPFYLNAAAMLLGAMLVGTVLEEARPTSTEAVLAK